MCIFLNILLAAITLQTYVKGKFCLAHIKCRVKTQMFLHFKVSEKSDPTELGDNK